VAAYMLFIEGASSSEANGLVARFGLESIERDESRLTWIDAIDGPGGKPGMIGSWVDPENLAVATFQPSGQKWTQLESAAGSAWVGTSLTSPLKPVDIQRRSMFEQSVSCLLADGNRWRVPIAAHLPHTWGEDAKGEFTRKPSKLYADFCREAADVMKYFAAAAAGSGDLKVEAQWSFACEALKLNYRLAPPIITALGLIDDRAGGRVLLGTIGMELSSEVQAAS
jgi:hypothetical protein